MWRIKAIYHIFVVFFFPVSQQRQLKGGDERELGAKAQIEKTSLGRPSITDIKVKTLFGGNNGCRHSPGVHVLLRVCAPGFPSDGEITGLSNQQMQTAENNVIGSPQRGILSGPSVRDAQTAANKDSRYFCLNQQNSTLTHF